MPVVHKSTIRRARQALRRQERNRATMHGVRTVLKKVLTAVEQKNVDVAKTSLREATSALRRAVKKGVLKRNAASRRISRLALRVNALTSSTS